MKVLQWLVVILAVALIVLMFYFLYTRIIKKKLSCKSSLLFIGDSITVSNSSYADYIIAQCPGIRYKKIAQVGKQTGWMLDELTKELQINKYDGIFILGGTNDIYAGTNVNIILNNLYNLFSRAKQSGATVIGIGPPSIQFNNPDSSKVQAYNRILDMERNNSDLDYFFDFSKFTNAPGDFAADKVHPTATANFNLGKSIYEKVF